MRLDSRQIGSYTFQECLGHGDASETWKAYDSHLHRTVVFKFLLASTRDGPDSLLSFKHEAEVLAALHHPTLASLYDARLLAPQQAETARAYVIRDYVEGQTLADYIRVTSRAGKFPVAVDLVHLFARMSIALDYAHRHNVLHGSLKPGNVLLRQNSHSSSGGSEPIITDLGMNRLLHAATNAPIRRSLDALLYISPEQAKGAPECEGSDLYALGIMLYEVCTGSPPFQGTRPIALLTQHVNAPPPSPNLINPHISPDLAQVIIRSMAKEPEERFENAVSMTIALAQALQVPLPEHINSLNYLGDLAGSGKYATPLSSSTSSRPVVSTESAKRRTITEQTGKGSAIPRPQSSPVRHAVRRKRPVVLALFVTLLLLTLITSGLGAIALLHRTPSPQTIVAGHAFFVSSGQLNENSNTQGINDEFQIDLSSIPDSGPGYSYYAWLLPDTAQTEAPPILLGKLPVEQGHVHFLYTGSKSHLNLLSVTSRFLITRETSSVLPIVPPPDTSLWYYYAEIPQAASPTDTLHFSMLGHFRHLLVESPELQTRGLHGGLVLWLVQTTQKVFDLSNSAREAWQAKNLATTRNQLIRLLDYLDGKDLARTDLPPGMPLLGDPRIDQIPLLGLKPKNADPPGYSYGDDAPPGYVYLISLHLSGALLSPEATPEQRTHATQINAALNVVAHWLAQAHDDAKQLVMLDAKQLAQPSSLALLNDLTTQTQAAYAGQANTTGQSQGGIIWISSNIQRLVDFVVTPYRSAN